MTASANASVCSKYMAWPQSSTICSVASGMRSAYRRPCSMGMTRSSSAHRTSVGAVIRCSRRSSLGLLRYGAQP